MSNNYAPCFSRIDFAVIPSFIELPCYIQVYKTNDQVIADRTGFLIYKFSSEMDEEDKLPNIYWTSKLHPFKVKLIIAVTHVSTESLSKAVTTLKLKLLNCYLNEVDN